MDAREHEPRGETPIRKFLKDESGATAIEYGLIAAIISIGVIAGAFSVGSTLDEFFKFIDTKISGAASP